MNFRNNLFVLIILIFLILFSSCKKEKEKEVTREELQKNEGIPVEIVTVKKDTILITVEASGDLKADDSITVSTENTGTIEQVLVKEGDYIKAGQTVAVIEPDDLEDQTFQFQAALDAAYLRLSQAQSNAILTNSQVEGSINQAGASVKAAEAQYNQARASLEASKEQLSLIEEGARTQEIAQAEQAVVQAEANLRDMELNLGRQKRLYEKGAVAEQQLDTAQVKYDIALAQYNSALEQLDLVKEGARNQEIESAKQQVKISEANVEAALASLEQAKEGLEVAKANRMQVTVAYKSIDMAQADVDQAKANLARITRQLEKSYVKTQISGYVTTLHVKAGDYAGGPGSTEIIDVFDPRSLYFEGVISETDIININQGLTVDVEVDGVPDKTFGGYIKEIIPKATESRQFTVKIALSNPPSELKPGMFARGLVLLAEHKDVVVIPKNCIRKNDITYVFTMENSHAVKKEVTVGPSMDGNIEIAQGLNPGEKVVYAGAVKDGDLVRVIKEDKL